MCRILGGVDARLVEVLFACVRPSSERGRKGGERGECKRAAMKHRLSRDRAQCDRSAEERPKRTLTGRRLLERPLKGGTLGQTSEVICFVSTSQVDHRRIGSIVTRSLGA